MVLRWLAAQLESGRRAVDCQLKPKDLGELFRTDAKGEQGRLVIGGWKCLGGVDPAHAEWFSLEIREAEAPWLFRAGDASRTIATGELLATLVAVRLFAPSGASHRAAFRMTGTTDNLGNAYVVRKLLSTKRPLGPLLMQLTSDLYDRQLWLDLRWVSRDSNVEADALTNGDFTAFDLSKRVPLTWSQVALPIAQALMAADAEFTAALEELRGHDYRGNARGRDATRPLHRKPARRSSSTW